MAMYDIGGIRRKNIFDQFGSDDEVDDLVDRGDSPEIDDLVLRVNKNKNQYDATDLSGGAPYQNLFGGQAPPVPIQSIPTQSSEPKAPRQRQDQSMDDILKQLEAYHPDTTASDNYNKLLSQFPDHETPSIGRRIVASMAGMGKNGIETGQKILDEPYKNDLERWKAQTDPTYKAAELERQNNVNERTLAGNMITAESNNRRLASQEQINQDRLAGAEKIAARKAQIDQQKVEIEKAKQNGYTFKEMNGHLIAIPPVGSNDQPYDSGVDLTDWDKLSIANITANARVQAAQTAATVKKEIADDKGWSQPVMISANDPTNPTRQIAVQTNLTNGQVREVKLDGKNVGPITKPGTPPKLVQPANIANIQNNAQETLGVLNQILDDKGELKPEVLGAVGKSRMFGLQHVYGSETRASDAKIERLKKRLVVDVIGEMKSQSRAGVTGFGQLNMRELDVLEKSASLLDPTLDEETFRDELKRIKEKLQRILMPADGLNPTTTTKPKMTPDDYLNKYLPKKVQ